MKVPDSKSVLFVGIQLVLLVLYFFPFVDFRFEPGNYLKGGSIGIGIIGLLVIILAIIQLNKNLTPFPTPVENGTLIQTGLYKFVRHPIYSGIILSTVFLGIADGSTWKIGIGFTFWLLFYFKSKYEESLLVKRFPDYAAYRKRSSRFFPYL